MFQGWPRADKLATFNLGWVRRWVCWRAHGLGWREDLHGKFDMDVRDRGFVNRVERIGKKYQWLALFEFAARMADNLQLLADRNPDEPEWLRNIDPSLLVRTTGRDEPSEGNVYQAHMPTIKDARSPEEALVWRDSAHGYIDGKAAVELPEQVGGRQWLALASFRSWSRSSSKGNRRFRFDAWARLTSVIVDRSDLEAVLDHLRGKDFRDDHHLPSNERLESKMFLGEHGWLNSTEQLQPSENWASAWEDEESKSLGVPAYPTTVRYERSPQERDQAVDTDITLTLPSLWLMRALGLRLTNGRDAAYVGPGGATAFFDPSIRGGGPSVGLVDRETMLSYLEGNGQVAVWLSSGEKNLYKDDGEGFGGRRHYTTISYSNGKAIVHLDRLSGLESPDQEQLRLFLA